MLNGVAVNGTGMGLGDVFIYWSYGVLGFD